MSPWMRYGVAGLVFLVLTTGMLWPWLDRPGRAGVTGAALVALPLQVVLFALLRASRQRMNRFLIVWAGGTLIRMGVVVAAVAVVMKTSAPPAPTLLALAGFLFGLLLLEPVFFRPENVKAHQGT